MTELQQFLKDVEIAHRERLAAENKENELIRPILYDLSRMEELYDCFSSFIFTYSNEPVTRIDNRRAFILIILRLYCPRVYAGYKLSRGIRDTIANVLKCEPTLISYNFRNLAFYYNTYSEFRNKVDNAYLAIKRIISE